MIPTAATTLNLGFLTVLSEPTGLVGGYLVTNQWGRPLEFRLSTAVQPNRVQQILYGNTLPGYLHGDLIGRALVEKTATPVRLLITDRPEALELRFRLEVPMAWLAVEGASDERGTLVRPAVGERPALWAHVRHAEDRAAIEEVLEAIEGLDLAEPFVRAREAMAEARKMGVTQRN